MYPIPFLALKWLFLKGWQIEATVLTKSELASLRNIRSLEDKSYNLIWD